MTQPEKHEPLPSHVVETIHNVMRRHLTLPRDLDHLGPLAELGHRHYHQAIGLELAEHPTLHAECIRFMEAKRIYPSRFPNFDSEVNHPEVRASLPASDSRLSTLRKIDADLPEEIKKVLITNNVEVIPRDDSSSYDLKP